MTREEEIQESEMIRNKMNEEYKKRFDTTYIGYPKFTEKPAFYYEIGKSLSEKEIS